jgi:hypothetical protein
MGNSKNKADSLRETAKHTGLSGADALIINSYMDALAACFGGVFEFVLHDIGGKDLVNKKWKLPYNNRVVQNGGSEPVRFIKLYGA